MPLGDKVILSFYHGGLSEKMESPNLDGIPRCRNDRMWGTEVPTCPVLVYSYNFLDSEMLDTSSFLRRKGIFPFFSGYSELSEAVLLYQCWSSEVFSDGLLRRAAEGYAAMGGL